MKDATKTLPPWADAELSADLQAIAAGGEKQYLELKEQFPPQAWNLAKEISAFATSNAGSIILGISNQGDVVGLASCDTRADREAVIHSSDCPACTMLCVAPTVCDNTKQNVYASRSGSDPSYSAVAA